MSSNNVQKWKKVRKSFFYWLLAGMVAGGGAALGFWDFQRALVLEISCLCLALGFWITEMLIGVFTTVKKANASAIVLLFLGKILWWGTLFWCSRHIAPGMEAAVASGIGIFLAALLLSSIQHYGMPRISDGNPPSVS